MYLDRWWTTLEGGEPNLEIEMEPHPIQRGGKRKKDPTRKDKIREEERQAASDGTGTGSMLDMIMGMVAVQHDCGYSTACPGWWCQRMAKKKILEAAIEQVTALVESLKLHEHGQQPEGRKADDQSEENIPVGRKPVTVWRRGKLEGVRRARTTSGTSDHHKPQEVKENVPEGRNVRKNKTICLKISDISEKNIENSIKSSRSPVKDIITSFENFQQNINKNHKTSTVIGNKSQLGRVKKLAENFIQTSESSPDNPAIRNSQVDGIATKKKKVIPEDGRKKPVPSRRVWTKLKSGLFGWKQSKPVSDSSRTSYDISKIPKIFTHMQPKNFKEESVSENSEIVPPKILFGGVGGSAVLLNIVTVKINNEGFKISAENKSSEQLPGGQMDETKKIGGELLSYKQQIPKS